MAKIKQSIVAQRQIPEHIRENYPLFVEFIKTYYDYLQQTQAQELETIRDVDTTLDEFIDKFKSELSKNFPINLATDKALILKHLREFYLARGSEDSFKFLFRVLFNKEAQLFYPSTQILRASDGRWKQDVSIFLDMTGMTFDMSQLVGRFITITTPNKVITTYVENTVNYSETIHELFIQRDYANEITIGSIVRGELDDGTSFESPILQCPTKVKIFKGGAGFKAGDIFALNTQLGRGCLIKITKVDSIGSIKSVQIIKFGLDYVTKFYSYLSSKNLENFEYIHPLKLNSPYVPGAPAYNEKAAGFIDYGWASKQTYFYYDTNVPVGDETFASDRYFADAGYVGDIQQQFYNDSSQTVMDEDLAIIEVDIGAVAKYPGYYLKSDGFISDEIYIQDGHYYQAFSYVVRVEEELRRYADIVKALIHPSGMKIFSEYSILNELNLLAKTPSVRSILQLPLFDNPPSTVISGDRGIGWTKYDTHVDEFGVTHTNAVPSIPPVGAAPVYANQGSASLLSTKTTHDIVEQITGYIAHKHVDKSITDAIVDVPDLNAKYVYKALEDTITNYVETVVKSYEKSLNENIDSHETYAKFVDTIKTDIQLINDSYSKLVEKPIDELISSPIDFSTKGIFKNLIENITQPDEYASSYNKPLYDSINNDDSNIKHYDKMHVESLSLNEIVDKFYDKNLSHAVTIAITQYIKNYAKTLSEIQDIQDILNKFVSKQFVENINNLLDSNSVQVLKNFSDAIASIIDNELHFIDKTVIDSQILDDVLDKYFSASYIDALNIIDLSSNGAVHKRNSDISLSDFIELIRTVLLEDIVSFDDTQTAHFIKSNVDVINITDENAHPLIKQPSDIITLSTDGRLRLNPYDSGDPSGYFETYSYYQPATAIT